MPNATDASQRLPLPDTLQFMKMLWGLSHALDRASKQMAGTIGVTGPQRLVLRVVGLRPGVSAGDLAGTLHVHPSTLTGVLQRLVVQKLLMRTPDPRDRSSCQRVISRIVQQLDSTTTRRRPRSGRARTR